MKPKGLITIIFVILFFVGILYLGYKSYVVFGFWNIILSGLLSWFSTFFLAQLIGSRAEKEGTIVYNPKEWPKFINFLVSLLIAYYLYTVLQGKEISEGDYIFGLSYIILLTVLPTLYSIYKLIRDRNDFIAISSTSVSYRDNSESGEFHFSNIKEAEMSKQGIKLNLVDETSVLIKVEQMNFNVKDVLGALGEIQARIPKADATTEQES